MNDKLKILAIDTVTEACSAAINVHGKVIQRLEIEPQGHSRLILDMVQVVMQQQGIELAELDAVAVDIGPGSFTGVRIGIGVAQGLAYAAKLPVIPVNSLETLAYATPHPLVLAAIDARMQQMYYAFYRNPPGNTPQAIIEPALIMPENLKISGATEVFGVGSAWDRYATALTVAMNSALSNWLPERYPEAGTVSIIAAAYGLERAISPLQLQAFYVRNNVAKVTAALSQKKLL